MKQKCDIDAKISAKESLASGTFSLSAYGGLVFVTLLFAGASLAFVQTRSRARSNQGEQTFLLELKTALEKNGIASEVVEDEGIVRVSTQNILFPIGKEDLSGAQLKSVDVVAAVLDKALACFSSESRPETRTNHAVKNVAALDDSSCEGSRIISFSCGNVDKSFSWSAVFVQGHADARPLVSQNAYRDNLALSAARSQMLLRRMYSCTPGLRQRNNESGLPLLNTAAFSTQRPANLENGLADENRRMELRFVLKN